jgi:hypothetical protein
MHVRNIIALELAQLDCQIREWKEGKLFYESLLPSNTELSECLFTPYLDTVKI